MDAGTNLVTYANRIAYDTEVARRTQIRHFTPFPMRPYFSSRFRFSTPGAKCCASSCTAVAVCGQAPSVSDQVRFFPTRSVQHVAFPLVPRWQCADRRLLPDPREACEAPAHVFVIVVEGALYHPRNVYFRDISRHTPRVKRNNTQSFRCFVVDNDNGASIISLFLLKFER